MMKQSLPNANEAGFPTQNSTLNQTLLQVVNKIWPIRSAALLSEPFLEPLEDALAEAEPRADRQPKEQEEHSSTGRAESAFTAGLENSAN